MRSVHLLLLPAAAGSAVLTFIAADVLRLLSLKTTAYVALLAATAALAITHGSTPLPAFTGGR
jgi:hypothetical protein